jgi:hypothetical protein
VAKGQSIILASEPKGHFIEGIIGDTSKPGTCMQVKAGVAPVSGRHTWIAAATGTSGYHNICAILLEDQFQGALDTGAYTAGRRGRLYVPINGEEMNVLLDQGAGTSNTIAIGDRFMLDGTNGIFIPVTTSNADVFVAMEAFTQVASPQLTWCIKT